MSFAFYDFETTGTSPAFDQPTQFAAILTNDDLEPLKRIDVRCRLSPHILPAPWALAVTGVTPDILTNPNLPTWFEFVQTLSALINQWGPATWTGYNNITFDEEVLRQSLYQNLHPSSYLTQMGGNDRLDVMKLVYATWNLEPDALVWPTDDSGRQSFKLDQMAPANGFAHHDAHNALGDVEATIYIASLIRDRAPDVWEQSLRNRSKQKVSELLQSGHPLRLIERFGATPPRSYIGAYAGSSTSNPNSVGFLDLDQVDPSELLLADDDVIVKAVDRTPKLVRTVAVNKVPNLFEMDQIDPVITNRAMRLAEMTDLRERIGNAIAARFANREAPVHVEEQIYAEFYSSTDQRLLKHFQTTSWEERVDVLTRLNDQRARQLGRRLIFLNRPDLLDAAMVKSMAVAIRDRWETLDDVPWTTFSEVEKQLFEIEEAGAMTTEEVGRLRAYFDNLREGRRN
ncbi:exonuclease domain-containing protein [Roseibium sp. MMSF_3412]|uniref:exonuclease domain-containing protein n=1 Tax=Roseibium sp. MMSF_3412 TaxID=3046712 RepID=UPI00273DDBFB|nr:exonuclease domain-containing protein [Roseibium sp. MMSF_3412]